MKKKYFLLFFILIWLIVIFIFSGQSSLESNGNSKNVIRTVSKIVIKITNKEFSDKKIDEIANKLNVPLRKTIHISEYFILSILILIILKDFNFKNYELYITTILLCILIATVDETHQLFVGRTGSFIDILIDTSGCVFLCFMHKLIKKQNNLKND